MHRVLPLPRLLALADPMAPSDRLFRSAPMFGALATPSTGPGTTTPAGGPPVIAFCSDEDVARRAQADYVALCGDSQMLARAQDGTFADPAGSPWTVTSASVDFEGQGVQAGDVGQLTPGRTSASGVGYSGSSQLLAIDSASGRALTLRRIGLGSGMGDPPVPPAGYPVPARFTVPTLYPQILDASRWLRQQYGLDDLIFGRRTSDLYDLTQFTDPCVYHVLAARYLEMARSAGEGGDDFAAKSKLFASRESAVLDRLSVRFRPSPVPSPEITRFSTRIVR